MRRKGLQHISYRAHSTSSLCCPASLSSIVSSIVCLLILRSVEDRLLSLESSLKVSRAFLIVASFRAIASRKAAVGEGREGRTGREEGKREEEREEGGRVRERRRGRTVGG